jgi:hypothetical protein
LYKNSKFVLWSLNLKTQLGIFAYSASSIVSFFNCQSIDQISNNVNHRTNLLFRAMRLMTLIKLIVMKLFMFLTHYQSLILVLIPPVPQKLNTLLTLSVFPKPNWAYLRIPLHQLFLFLIANQSIRYQTM